MRVTKQLIASFILFFIASSVTLAYEKTVADMGFGCIDKDYTKKLLSMLEENDSIALSKGLAAGMMQGTCTSFKKGDVVSVSDTEVFSGLKKVRRRGNVAEYWTFVQFIEP